MVKIQMVNEYNLKQGIARMYYAMARVCKRHCDLIENDMSNFHISNLKQGYEIQMDDVKYQLVLELKKVENL